ncbi:MAG: nuclear transport factor 2 family protein [Planctomycetota bacterium]
MLRNALATSLVASVSIFLASCQCAPTASQSEDPGLAISEAEIRELMDQQLEDWNSGSLEDFVAPYAESTTFVGASGLTVSRERVLANYRLGYPDPASRGTLTFELENVRPLGSGAAIVIGQWSIDRGEPVSGWFSLVVERAANGALQIVHDHSS